MIALRRTPLLDFTLLITHILVITSIYVVFTDKGWAEDVSSNSLWSWKAHTNEVTCMSLVDSDHLISASEENGGITTWRIDNKSLTASMMKQSFPDFLFHRIAVVRDRKVLLGSCEYIKDHSFNFVAAQLEGNKLLFLTPIYKRGTATFAVANNVLVIRKTLDTLMSLDDINYSTKRIYKLNEEIKSFCLSTNGTTLCVAGISGVISLFDLKSGDLKITLPVENRKPRVHYMVPIVETQILAVNAIPYSDIFLLELSPYKIVQHCTLPMSSIYSLVVTNDHKYAVVGIDIAKPSPGGLQFDGAIDVIQIDNMSNIKQIKLGRQSSGVTSVIYDQKYHRIIAGDLSGKIWIWNCDLD